MAALLLVLFLSSVTSSLAGRERLFPKKSHADYRHKDPKRLPADQRRPLNTVRVTCHPDSLEILVQADLFGVGAPVHSYEVRLGLERDDVHCSAVPSTDHEYRILVGLLDCGTKYWMTDVSLVYTNLLIYTPAPSPDGLIRMDGAVVPIECHYARRYSLSSSSLAPTWIPFMSTQAAVETLDFKLRIMTNDWQYERGANVYYLGEPIFIEASVRVGHHVGLRVFLSSCVATLQPDINSVPRYVFIESGCLLDSKLQPSKSRFLVRTQDDKLQLVIDAFRFHDDDRGELYITCLMNAVPVHDTEAPNKACTFVNGRWRSADGNDYLCGYCQSDAGQHHSKPAKLGPRGFSKPTEPEFHSKSRLPSGWEQQAKVGPVLVLPKQNSWTVPDETLPPMLQKISRSNLYGSQWMSGLNYLNEPEKGLIPGLFTEDLDDDLTAEDYVDSTSEMDDKSDLPEPTPTMPDERDDNSTELVELWSEADATLVSNLTNAQADNSTLKDSKREYLFVCVCPNMLARNTMLPYFCLTLLLGSSIAIRTLKDGPMIDKEGRQYKKSPVIIDADDPSGIQSNVFSPSVHVTCTSTSMIIQVKADMYGQMVSPGEIFLGGVEYLGLRQCQAFPAGDSELVIKAGLEQCGTTLSVSDDSMIYSNQLAFSPAPHRHGIARKTHSTVPVSCHYQKTQVVSSQPLVPPPIPATSAETSAFSLRLMSDDWTRPRLSNVFYLEDVLNVEASYTNPGPEPRRLFLDSCVATLSPDAASVPRYFLIENHGCLTDSRQRGSRTRFLARTRADVLLLQLDAFLFNRDERNTLFLTCRLKATSDMWRSSPFNKACTYVNSRWENVDGSPEVCRCCDGTCKQYSYKQLMPDGTKTCDVVVLGPLVILSKM
ncbi:zona pellucida glycoprotein 3e [Vanacampus margaritifer]